MFYDSGPLKSVFNELLQRATRHVVHMIDHKKDSVVDVSCKHVHTESRSAGINTVQVQGWLIVEGERAFVDWRKW